MIFTSIKNKITLAVLLLVVLLMSVTGISAMLYFEKNFKQNISREQFALLDSVATQIDERMFDFLVDLDTLADSITPALLASPDKAQRLLDAQMKHREFFNNSLSLFSKTGRLVASSPLDLNFIGKDYSFRDYFKYTVRTGKIYVSPPFESIQKKNHTIIMFTSPVYDANNTIIGVLGGSVDLKKHRYLRSLAVLKLGQKGFLSLHDTSRNVLMHSDKSRILQQESPGANKLLDKALTGFEGTGETSSQNGIPVISSVKRLKSTDWILTLSYPLRESYAPLYAARKYFLAGSIVAVLLSLLIIWPLVKYLTNPLLAFTRHIEQFPDMERPSQLIHIHSNDEIGIMEQTFNRMVIELDHQKLALKAQKDFAENLVLNSSLATFVIDPQHKILIWNNACDELTGVKAADIIGTTRHWSAFYENKRPSLADVIVDGSYDTLPLQHMKCERSKLISAGWHCEGWYEQIIGKRRYVLIDAAPIYNDKGELIAAIETIRDITELKMAEQEIRKSEERYRQLFESNPQPMWVFDLETLAFLEINNAAVRHYGYSREEFLAMSIKDIRPPEDVPALINNVAKVTKGIDEAGVWRHLKKDGNVILVEITSHTMKFAERAAEIVMANDVTEKVQSEEVRLALEHQLRQSQKMEAIGTLAGGVAHDFNNILTAIVGYATLIQMDMEVGNPLQSKVSQILSASERAAKLTHGLLAYSRKQVSIPTSVTLNSIITDIEKLLRRLIPENIEFKSLLTEEKLTIMADSTQIGQVLMNLIVNARDAMCDGGELRIATEQTTLDQDFIAVHGYGNCGSYALLTISDSGIGMDEKTRERIFEPFFTTKEVGKGTGLGLAMVYGIIKQHNGYINCYSEQGHGTVFRIYLPLIDAPLHKVIEPNDQDVAGGNETILLVEDDENLREILGELLEDFGYTVIKAVDGEDAVNKFKKFNNAVQMVILDVIMPKMNGKDAYNIISTISPGIKVLFMSGYTADIVTSDLFIENTCSFVSKPIRVNELLSKTREILDAC